jgi:DNA-binding MurR/RpiR family transcriptional regulator
MQFLQGREMPQEKQSSELSRVREYIDSFDESMVTELLALMESHNNIILFGYGPSFLCAQYFEYRLRIFSNKIIVALSDEISVASIADENTLLIIMTVTGAFQSFQNVCAESRKKGCDVVLVAEEYNTNLFGQCDRIFWLSKYPQPINLLPYEKTRTVFFLFFEEIIQRLLLSKKADEDQDSVTASARRTDQPKHARVNKKQTVHAAEQKKD